MRNFERLCLVLTIAPMRRIMCIVIAAVGLSSPVVAGDKSKQGAATFAPATLPVDHDGASLLTIPAPGRYSIRAKSPSGARIELVDMIAGPIEAAGAAGLRDGRIDALLDAGVYKLRLAGVNEASGKATLYADSFVEMEAARSALVAGKIQSGELGDLQQRSYALEIAADHRVGVEAIGRALQDLRIWSADGELMELSFERLNVEPKPGHAMTRLRLDGTLPKGRYVVTAYGGEKLVWSDGAAAQPFLIRLADPATLAAGVMEGVIGPFGGERFEAPARYDAFRLELPQSAPARLDARRGGARATEAIVKNSRTPAALLRLSGDGKTPAQVEVAGFEGQSYTLRALHQANRETFEAAGPHLVSIDLAGEGGDEAPATALLARIEKDGKTRVIASDVPHIGAGEVWRGKFNLFGTTSILFEAKRDGLVAIDAKGVKLRATIEPALGALAARADGKDATRYDLQAGYYFLTLEPVNGAAGVVDVTLGPPGLAAPAPNPPPSRATMSFGEQPFEKDGSYLILVNTAPSLLTGPCVVALPAELDKEPLAVRQEAGREIALPVKLPKTGRVLARDGKGAEIALTLADEKIENETRLAIVKIASAPAARAIGLTFVPEAPATENKETAAADAGKAARIATPQQPAFFDLAQDETKRLRLNVTQGGLYRVETLGRMKTALRVGANVAPRLGEGEANGPGANALVTTFLRAGAYRAAVTAKESAGHLGLAVTPASLTTTAKLVDDGMARATLAAGKGAAIPFEITKAADYRFDLMSLTRKWRVRLEDSDGWPLTAPGEMSLLTRRFEPGAYRLIVTPEDVEARLVVRLTPIHPASTLAGHGPHALPFEDTQKLQWREPQAKDAPRAPDVWRFTLHGDSDIDLSIGEGMIGEIFRGVSESVGKATADRAFKSKLSAGEYRVEARSLAHDDRLDYEIALTSAQLQPGAPRQVDLPARLDFALAEDSVVDISSFGDKEAIGVLKDAAGEVVERLATRADDWNVALSRRLPAGAYRLEIEELGAEPKPLEKDRTAASADEDAAEEEGDAESVDANADQQEVTGVEVSLALPGVKGEGALVANETKQVVGADAHAFALPAAQFGKLRVVAAQAESDVALSIEKRENGVWRAIGVERGRAPVAAWPASDDSAEWRAVVWPLGGAPTPASLTLRDVERRERALGAVALDAVEGLPLCVARVATPDMALVEIGATETSIGSAPGQLLRPSRKGFSAPQSGALWLLSRGDCRKPVSVAAFDWRGQEVALDLGAGERAMLPQLDAPRGKTRLWLARAATAQPGLEAGRGFGAAKNASLALAGDTPLQLWNASGGDAMRVNLRAIDVEARAAVKGGGLYSGVIPPISAQPVEMDEGDAPLAIELAGGLAAFVDQRALFGDGAAISRIVQGARNKLLLVNLTDAPLPARIAREGESKSIAADNMFKRFFPTAGETSFVFKAQPGDRLIVVGAEATVIVKPGVAIDGEAPSRRAPAVGGGSVRRGRDIALFGAGEAVLSYTPGLVAAWIERNGAAPWPQAQAHALTPPQRVRLEGAAMRFTLKAGAPVLLNARSDAPALVALTQKGGRETFGFANGVNLHRYISGDVTLDLIAPNDGALSGILDIATQPVIETREGVNDAIVVQGGASALFSFEMTREGDVGVGLRAEPDRITARLLDADGRTLGEGVAQTVKLKPGRYFLEARVPADVGATTIRAAIVGVSPPPVSPPADVVAELLGKAGLKKSTSK